MIDCFISVERENPVIRDVEYGERHTAVWVGIRKQLPIAFVFDAVEFICFVLVKS